MLPVIPLAVKLALLFDSFAAVHGGFLSKPVIYSMKKLVLKNLEHIGDWAAQLVAGELKEGLTTMRAWLKGKVSPMLPKWIRNCINADKRVDSIIDWLIENEEAVMEEMKSAENRKIVELLKKSN